MSQVKGKGSKSDEKRAEGTDESKSKSITSGKDISFEGMDSMVLSFASSLQYLGYDPAVFFDVIKGKCKSDSELRNDLLFAATMLLTRGSAIHRTKVQTRTGEAGSALMKNFTMKWNIIRDPQRPTDVTIARMCGTAVGLVAKVANALLRDNKLRTVVPAADGLVPAMCQPIMASIIPDGKPALLQAFKNWSVRFGQVAVAADDGKSRSKKSATAPADNSSYADITFKSSYYQPKERIIIMKDIYMGTPSDWYRNLSDTEAADCANCAYDKDVAVYIAKSRDWKDVSNPESVLQTFISQLE